MWGYMRRGKAEEILDAQGRGAFMYRIGSGERGGLVMSAKLSDGKGGHVHVIVDAPGDKKLLPLLVPTLDRMICSDGTILSAKNVAGLYAAEGIKLPPSDIKQ